MKPTHTSSISLAVALIALCMSSRARADAFGADLPLLSAILVQTTDQVTRMAETLGTLKKSYDDARRVAAYADDAYQAFNQFRSFNVQLLGQNVTQTLTAAYPDIGVLRRQASDTGPWARGTGELQRLVSLCLGGGTAGCAQFQEAISVSQAREALSSTFGLAPGSAHDLKAVDHEAAVALSSSSSQQGRSTSMRAISRQLLSQCGADETRSQSPLVLAQCQAAAASAQIVSLEQNADLADQVAEGNRLQALQLAQHNAVRKRELLKAEERRSLLLDNAARSAPRPVPVLTEGFNLFDEGQ